MKEHADGIGRRLLIGTVPQKAWRLCVVASVAGLILFGAGFSAFRYLVHEYPSIQALDRYDPSLVNRIYADDGQIIHEFGEEKRALVPIERIPPHVQEAFLAAEDKNFRNHFGIDPPSIFSAVLINIPRMIRGQRMVGASTITQQLAKLFVVGNDYSFHRKFMEAVLSIEIERKLSKNRILELYLNEIYFGRRSYGLTMAALNYFDKSPEELTIAEAAFLAALPKAPENYNPDDNPDAALARRNWVIGRLLANDAISQDQARAAWNEPLTIVDRQVGAHVRSAYFTEAIRRQLVEQFGEDMVGRGGFSVRSTMDPALQNMAAAALDKGLLAYDRRHGWRGALLNLGERPDLPADIRSRLPKEIPGHWAVALVRSVHQRHAAIVLETGRRGTIPFAEMRWARPTLDHQRVGRSPRSPRDVVARGDVVLVEALPVDPSKDIPADDDMTGPAPEAPRSPAAYGLRQIPDVNGAIVALDPRTGRVLAMQGGFSMAGSHYNRATQARRQPGSSFKPFIYLAALSQGLPPNAIVHDTPVSYDQGPGLPPWQPRNYDGRSSGPRTLRYGIERSRNQMTVRLADMLGMDEVVAFAQRFGLYKDATPTLSMALGSGETTLIDLVTAYAMIVNGGKRIAPAFMDIAQDRNGAIVYRAGQAPCPTCRPLLHDLQGPPETVHGPRAVVDERSAYQMVSILQGVVTRGTGIRLAELELPLGGKTGTTDNYFDAWFIGFSSDIVVGVYVGFDYPRTLGRGEAGSRVALPVFKDFIKAATTKLAFSPFPVPPGVTLVRTNRGSGVRVRRGGIEETFKMDQIPALGTGGPLVQHILNRDKPVRVASGSPYPRTPVRNTKHRENAALMAETRKANGPGALSRRKIMASSSQRRDRPGKLQRQELIRSGRGVRTGDRGWRD